MDREGSTEINLENWGPGTTVKSERGENLGGIIEKTEKAQRTFMKKTG